MEKSDPGASGMQGTPGVPHGMGGSAKQSHCGSPRGLLLCQAGGAEGWQCETPTPRAARTLGEDGKEQSQARGEQQDRFHGRRQSYRQWRGAGGAGAGPRRTSMEIRDHL